MVYDLEILDSSAVIKLGNDLFLNTFGNFVVPFAINEELLSHNRIIPETIGVLATSLGPSFTDFKKEDTDFYSWTSTENNYNFQLVNVKGHFKAACGKHESNFQLSIVGLDLAFYLCNEIVKTPDLAVLTACLINPRSKFKSFDSCLIETINNLRHSLQASY
jgi:hypothetical protein